MSAQQVERQELATQWQALQNEQSRLASQLKFAERRIATLEEALAHAESEAAVERDKRQAAVGEANVLKVVNASQRAQLDELMRAAAQREKTCTRRAAGNAGRQAGDHAPQGAFVNTTPTRWIDHGVTPPAPLPDDILAALAYLTHALGHVCYERWTFTRMKQAFPSFGEAKAAKPAMFRLLLDLSEAVEWWERGRARVASAFDAPAPHITSWSGCSTRTAGASGHQKPIPYCLCPCRKWLARVCC